MLVRENFYFDLYAVIITVGHVNKSNKVEGFYGKFNHVPTVMINPMHKKKIRMILWKGGAFTTCVKLQMYCKRKISLNTVIYRAGRET